MRARAADRDGCADCDSGKLAATHTVVEVGDFADVPDIDVLPLPDHEGAWGALREALVAAGSSNVLAVMDEIGAKYGVRP